MKRAPWEVVTKRARCLHCPCAGFGNTGSGRGELLLEGAGGVPRVFAITMIWEPK